MSVLTFTDCTAIIRQPLSSGDDKGKPVVVYLGLRLVTDGQHLTVSVVFFLCETESDLSE